jgi:hypothetical protein
MARKMDLDSTGMEFTRQWFRNRNLPTFREYIHPKWAGQPITYLELGVFEGQSMCWMLQHILTDLDARAVGIDPWLMTTKLDEDAMEDVHERAVDNLRGPMLTRIAGGHPKCTLFRANSAEILRRMVGRHGFAGIKSGTVDLCMVDGNHNALAVLDDLRLVYQLVKPRGWILCDDWNNDRPKVDHVKEGVEMWLKEVGEGVRTEWQHKYMICFSKV